MHKSLWLAVFFLGLLPHPSPAQKPDTLKTLVLLTDFSDAPGTLDINEVKRMLNGQGYTSSSVPVSARDYWSEVSRNKLVVVFDVLGYYRANQTATYYRTKSWQDGVTMAAEGFNWVAKTMPNYNWNALTVNQDNRFRGLCIIPSTDIPASGATHYLGDQFIAPNKAKGNRLSIIGITGGLFGFNHELGHMAFDWPDLYSITGGRGVGAWELMAGNDQVPGIPNAVYRAGQGWMDMQDAVGNQTITLEENGPTALRIRNPSDSQEYFVVEARNSSLRTTKSPAMGRGLLIWHFDEKVSGNGNYSVMGEKMTPENHYQVSLEQADGKFDLEYGRNGGDSSDAYIPGKAFGKTTVPNSNWWDGSASGVEIDQITMTGSNKISFRLKSLGVTSTLFSNTAQRHGGNWTHARQLAFHIPSEGIEGTAPMERIFHTLDGKLYMDNTSFRTGSSRTAFQFIVK